MDFFNHSIVENHEHIMTTSNSISKLYGYCLSDTIFSDDGLDQVWFYEQKKSHLFYDV